MMKRRWACAARASALVLLAAIEGCSGTKHVDDSAVPPEPIAECEAYSSDLRSCAAQLGPSAAKLAATQGAYVTQSAAAGDDDARAALRATCIAARRQLATACR